ncbi:HTH Tnp Tc3 2 domain containing protein, partial [Asbolus verrucosus]
QTGVASRRPRSGARHVTTPRVDRFLIIQARRQPFAIARQHLQSLSNVTGTRISDQTVRNRLREEEEIIMEYVVPRTNAIGRENLIFLDNARPHRAQNVILALSNNEMNLLPLPPLSPELNPIEHVWNMLQNHLNSHDPHPRTVRELGDILPDLCHEIPQEQIDNCIESMPNKCPAVIEAQGASIRY